MLCDAGVIRTVLSPSSLPPLLKTTHHHTLACWMLKHGEQVTAHGMTHLFLTSFLEPGNRVVLMLHNFLSVIWPKDHYMSYVMYDCCHIYTTACSRLYLQSVLCPLSMPPRSEMLLRLQVRLLSICTPERQVQEAIKAHSFAVLTQSCHPAPTLPRQQPCSVQKHALLTVAVRAKQHSIN